MERPQNLNLTPRASVIIILLFHLVGLAGFTVPAAHLLFLKIVPWHLLLMLLVITLTHQKLNNQYIGFAVIIFLTGFITEWIGVHTGWLFGTYAYDGTLGIKLFSIPLMIGVNWFLLVYAAGVTMQRGRLKSIWLRVLTGAAILVALDVLIEPVAVKFGYWHWAGKHVPFKNYLCWYMVSAAMLLVFELFNFKKQSIAAPVLLVTEFVFFGMLNIISLL